MKSGRTSGQGALGWAIATCLIAALVGLIGYTVGASDREEAAAEAAPATPELIPLSDAYRSGRSEGFRRGRLRAYREGRLEGLAEGRRAERRRLRAAAKELRRAGASEALEGLASGGWFLVSPAPDGQALSEQVQVEEGLRYELCREGASVCSATSPERPSQGRSSR